MTMQCRRALGSRHLFLVPPAVPKNDGLPTELRRSLDELDSTLAALVVHLQLPVPPGPRHLNLVT